ncbi:SMI1/KNR4 family protein [Paenibacillus foliorum]|uniref:SMI1/KNR4 family protein n=1 Tax=Paenibacillus foliorum TaxID=2654974 RepID=UPI0028AE5D5F|nr:SMI1/KNR4 family protein [Paenibacillus foliorum]
MATDSGLTDCRVSPPKGLPRTNDHSLPLDLKRFYELCGGVVLFENKDFHIQIAPPNEFILSNPVIVGEQVDGNISSHWYIVGLGGNGDYISIDLHQDRLGKCYDSFWDRHGVMGDCPVVAKTFTELINRLVQNNGERWYWLSEDFESLGDAYDDVVEK